MRVTEPNLFPEIMYPRFHDCYREVTSMSDRVHADHRSKVFVESRTIESRLMFAACYVIFLAREIVKRLIPWREHDLFRKFRTRESIFKEASSAASIMVATSFMGL